MSAGRWIKPAFRLSFPRTIASVIVRGSPVGPESRHGRTMHAFSYAWVSVCRFRRGAWGPSPVRGFADPREALDYLETTARPRELVRVLSPAASRALTLLRLWERWEEAGVKWSPRGDAARGSDVSPSGRLAGRIQSVLSSFRQPVPDVHRPAKYTVSRLVLRGKPDIVNYSFDGKSLAWASGNQYLTGSEESLAASVGFDWPLSGGPLPAGSVMERDGADRCALWMLLFKRMSDWWRECDGGPWAATAGGLSMSYFRHRLKPKTVLSHNNPDARRLEEASLFGGRASLWYYGEVGDTAAAVAPASPPPPAGSYGRVAGPVELWDVRSMYPTILANELFPVRLRHYWHAPSVAAVRQMLDSWLVIASVRVATDAAEYSYRTADRITYPTGEFDCVLTTPELKRAFARDEVRRVYAATTYDPGRPFSSAALGLIELRAKAAGGPAGPWQEFVKLVSNNFGGKLAQRKHGWRELPGYIPERKWGEWVHRIAGDGERVRFRAIAGLAWVAVPARDHGRPLAACFAHLTAYGRDAMRSIRATLADRQLISQDTDGIWVRGTGDQQFELASDTARTLGFSLACKHTLTAGRWYGPRHYWTPRGWVLSGFHDQKVWSDGRTIDDSYVINPVIGTPRENPSWVWECRRTTELSTLPADGRVGPDGWVTPHRIAPPSASPP